MPPRDKLEVLQGTLDILILRTLQWGPQHGHGIGQMIRAKSDDVLQVEHGSLYPALHRLHRAGFLDGMGLSISTGFCWRPLAESIPGFTRVPPKNIVLAGVRETDADEQRLLDESGVQQIPAEEVLDRGMRPLLTPALAAISRRIDCFYIHFDLDVLDPSVTSWNQWTPPRGLKIEHVEEALDLLAGCAPIVALGFASHDPRLDPERSFEAARRILDRALAIAGA
jgi:arginase family enzyme